MILILSLSLSYSPGIWGTDHHTHADEPEEAQTWIRKKKKIVEFTRKKLWMRWDARGKIRYICSICIYIYTHIYIYIYTKYVRIDMCTHIYICIMTYSIRCFDTLFFWKDNGNGDESERTAIGRTEEKETKEEDVFFWEGSPNYGVHLRTCWKSPTLTPRLLECLSSTPSFCYRCCFLIYAK